MTRPPPRHGCASDNPPLVCEILTDRRLAIIGAGAMGEALASGLLRAGIIEASRLTLADVDESRLQAVANRLGVATTSSNREAVRDAEVVVLAVKPQIVQAAMTELASEWPADRLMISLAAGVKTVTLEGFLQAGAPVVRVMPNTPALVGQAATAICRGTHATENHRQVAHALFGAVGLAVDCDEKLLDAVTGLSGSGPAYVYVFIEALSDAGVEQGLPRDVAAKLAAQTVLGAAQMVLQTGQHPGALKDLVTSPGGTTIHGLHALEDGAFRGTVMAAVAAATRRAKELG